MNNDFWAALQSDMPEMLWAEHDENYNLIQRWSWVRLRDTGTGSEILFFENLKVLEVEVRTPTDPMAAQQLLAVLSSSPIWSASGQRHTTSWRLLTEDEDSRYDSYYAEAAEAVTKVMREGLGMDPTRMRYAAGDRSGPLDVQWTWSDLLTADPPLRTTCTRTMHRLGRFRRTSRLARTNAAMERRISLGDPHHLVPQRHGDHFDRRQPGDDHDR